MASNFDFDLTSPLEPYLKAMITNLPNGPKLIMQALAEQDYNKEDLSIESRVRRGELNFALCWIEALGFTEFKESGRQKLYTLTPLGRTVISEYKALFLEMKDEKRE